MQKESRKRCGEFLNQFDFEKVFIEELGWSRPPDKASMPIDLELDANGLSFTRTWIAVLKDTMVIEVVSSGNIPLRS